MALLLVMMVGVMAQDCVGYSPSIPSSKLKVITTPAEYKREFFRRNSSQGTAACVSRNLFGKFSLSPIYGTETTLNGGTIGAIRQTEARKGGRFQAFGQDITFLVGASALEKFLIQGPPKHYGYLNSSNGFSDVQQIGFRSAFASSLVAAGSMYRLVIFSLPADTAKHPIVQGTWDNAFDLLSFMYGVPNNFIAPSLRNLIKKYSYQQYTKCVVEQGNVDVVFTRPPYSSNDTNAQACRFGCPSFLTITGGCQKDWVAAVQRYWKEECNFDGRWNCTDNVEMFLNGGPYNCDGISDPTQCKALLEVRAFFLIVLDFNPIFMGDGWTASGYGNLISRTNQEYFMKTPTRTELAEMSPQGVAELYWCMNGKYVGEDPSDDHDCCCVKYDPNGECTAAGATNVCSQHRTLRITRTSTTQ